MNLQDLADALQDCAGACSICRKSGDNGGHCCGSRLEATELKLTCMIPITKEMIMLGREWIGKYIRQALNEACCSAAEEVRKTLCLPREGMKWNENKDRLCRYNDVVLCDWPEERPGRCKTCPCNPERIDRTEWECEA